jgi:hypothetical protein
MLSSWVKNFIDPKFMGIGRKRKVPQNGGGEMWE